MKSFKRGEKGFTLIELLIVVAILGILAAVVIPNVVGLMGRGGKQALGTDQQTVQLAVSAFYSDTHEGYDANGQTMQGASVAKWGDSGNTSADHYYPCALAAQAAPFLLLSASVFDAPKQPTNPRIDRSGNTSGVANGQDSNIAATTQDITNSAIWMGLLVNAPGTFVQSNGVLIRGNVSVLGNDTGLYLQSMPRSAKSGGVADTTFNGALPPGGGYAWIVGYDGTVYSAYQGANGNWYSGYSGAYP